MAWLVQETAAEFEVLSMRAERGTWEPLHAVFTAVLIGEHLRHAGAIGTTEVEGDVYAIAWDVMRVSAIESCAVGLNPSTAAGQPRGLLVRHLATTGWPRGVLSCHLTTTGQPRGLFVEGRRIDHLGCSRQRERTACGLAAGSPSGMGPESVQGCGGQEIPARC